MPMAPDIRGRFPVEPTWPGGGYMVTAPMDERYWTIQQFTGYPVSNLTPGNWSRGAIIKSISPNLRPPVLGYYPYDPTDPSSWHQLQH
jgi:hypothetical protein